MDRKQKRSALTAAVMCLSMLRLPVSAAGTLPGDVNGDGEITIVDAVIYQGWLLGHDNVTILAPENADIDGDGKVNAKELTLVKRMLLYGTEITPPDPPVQTDGRLYQRIGLTDQQAGIVAYEGLLPDGWTVQMSSNWQNISSIPGQETVVFSSPEGNAIVTVTSPMLYMQSSNRDYGPNLSEYTTYMPYLTADQYIEYFVQNAYTDAALTEELEIDAEQQEAVEGFALYKAQALRNDANLIGLNVQVQGYEGTVSRRQYSTENGPAEFTCAVAGCQYYYTLVAGFGITNIPWYSLNTVSFQAADRAAFDKYYSDYEMIAANGWFTAAFFNCNDYVSTKIGELILEARTQYVSEDPFKDYDPQISEVTAEERETSERIFQAWDDVIMERDRYTTEDGGTFTTSMYNQTVAQDGDSFFVGNTADVPYGYTILPKN